MKSLLMQALVLARLVVTRGQIGSQEMEQKQNKITVINVKDGLNIML